MSSQQQFDPTQLRYAETHEWAHLEGDIVTVGITDFAVKQLTDLTGLQLDPVGTQLNQGDQFGVIESVKAVSDLYAPVAGEIAEVNQQAEQDVSIVASDPYGAGWLIKIRVAPGTTLDHLMTYDQYQAQISAEDSDQDSQSGP